MTNEEIRIAIAKAKKIEVGCFYELFELTKFDDPAPSPERILQQLLEDGASCELANWPENIADAWELFEEMPAPKVIYAYTRPGGIEYDCGCAGISDPDGDYYPYNEADNTIARAICLAWLAWDAARKAEK